MEPAQSTAGDVLRFGIFELDPVARELRRNGSVVRLPPQPFQVLLLLAANSGEVVDRDRIRREVWGDTTVDFDRSLNVCMTQIRSALNDDAESPRFIQTLPRRGYRFLAKIERRIESTGRAAAPAPVRRFRRVALGAALLAVVVAAGWYRVGHPQDQALRIAVLPFDRVGLPDDRDAQVEGLFDELLTRLGGIQPDRLRVIGRRSVARFANERKPLREIGERLNVRFVIEGTVRTEAGQLHVATRLVKADDESVVWSDSFVQAGGPAEFEGDVVARVSAAALTKLFPGAPAGAGQQAACREGWQAYRTGRLLANRGSLADMEKSIAYFEQAACAPSRAAIAETMIRMARATGRRPELWDRARTAARDALTSDPELPGAHISLGNIAFWHDWNWKTSEQEFQAALKRNPSDPDAHHDLAWLLMALGRKQEAIAALQRAIALDPLSARISVDSGWLYLQAGRFREAAEQARRALDLAPQMSEARACLARALLYAGDDRSALDAIRGVTPQPEIEAVAALSAREATRVLLRNSIRDQGSMDAYQRAWRFAWLGSNQEALAELEAAFRTRSTMMPLVAVDPAFTSLRKEPRYQNIVRAMGL